MKCTGGRPGTQGGGRVWWGGLGRGSDVIWRQVENQNWVCIGPGSQHVCRVKECKLQLPHPPIQLPALTHEEEACQEHAERHEDQGERCAQQ